MPPAATVSILDFDIRVLKADTDTYLVTAQTPESGLARGMLDWQALSSDDFKAQLRQIKEEPYSTDEALFRSVGTTLFDALVQNEIRDLFISVYSQKVQNNENAYLRLRLDILETAVDVAMLPWELLAWNDMFLATQIKTLFTRQYLDLQIGNIRSLTIANKPRALIVIPRGSGLATDAEKQTVVTALQNAGIPYDILDDNVTVQTLDDQLASQPYHILHFIGHGEFREADDGALHGSLRFNTKLGAEGDDENEEWVADSRLRALLGNYESIRLVVLNACKGAEVAAQASGSGFIGTAPALLKARIPAVIAMQYSILDPVALLFAETFYKRLTQPGPWAGHVDIALTLARNECYVNFHQDRGFASPILYLRAPNGQIFSLDSSEEEAELPSKPGGSECEEVPQPEEETLYKYRHSQVDTIAAAAKALQENIATTRLNIQRLRTLQVENPVLAAAERADIALPKLQQNLQEAMTELDEMIAIIRWKANDLCQKIVKERQEIEQLKNRVQDLRSQNRIVPAGLKGDIARRAELVRKMKIRAEKAEEFLQFALPNA
ncbi:MAG: CHAT domain-containing protein [Chloroflexi bacterium]|nr:CHAT domain-containing protein [Chloroflexota bacterium]